MTPVGTIVVSLLDGVRSRLTLPELLCLRAFTYLPVLGVAMSAAEDSRVVRPLAASDPRSAVLQRSQVALGEGPCLESLRTGRINQVADLRAEGAARWPHFTEVARSLGIRSVLSIPLYAGAVQIGVLDLFGDRTGPMAADDLALVSHHVDAAVLVLLHLQEMEQPDLHRGRLEDDSPVLLYGHPEVQQATAMVAVQADASLADALLLLRARAFAAERSLLDVAGDVVARRLSLV